MSTTVFCSSVFDTEKNAKVIKFIMSERLSEMINNANPVHFTRICINVSGYAVQISTSPRKCFDSWRLTSVHKPVNNLPFRLGLLCLQRPFSALKSGSQGRLGQKLELQKIYDVCQKVVKL